MKLKTVTVGDKTYAEIQDGKPVFVKDDGTEVAFDAPGTVATISRLNGEAKTHREAKEAAQTELKKFEGISDPAAAVAALKTVANLKDKQLVDAGEVEKVKAEAIKAVEEKYKPIEQERDKLKAENVSEKRSNAFSRSKFIADKVAVPVDLMEAKFGDRFKVEDGKLIGYDANGQKIFSVAKPGEVADFDEALSLMVGAYPNKASILKGTGNSGSGAGHGGGDGKGGKTITRTDFNALDPLAQGQKMADGFTITD